MLLLRMSHAEKFSEQKTITTQADSAKFVYAADIDGDEMMNFFRIVTIDLSDVFSTFQVCSFIGSFRSSFNTYMMFLPGIFITACIAAGIMSVCIEKSDSHIFLFKLF